MIINNRKWISRQERKATNENARLNKEMANNKKQIQELKEHYPKDVFSKEAIELNKQISNLENRNEDIAKILDTVTTYTYQSIENKPYTPGPIGFSMADLAGRDTVDANRVHIVFDNYNNTAIAETVNEGEEATDRKLDVTLLKTDSTEAINLDDIVTVGIGTYEDDPNIETLIDHDHAIALTNAENKKAIEVLIGSKDAIQVSAENLQEAINANLCGKAKANAIILVNKSGFALLDVDVNGVSLVTKDPDGRFIYKHKYEIIELADEILSNGETGDPIVIIGDLANVVKFFIIRDSALTSDNFGVYSIGDRRIRKEIIALSTDSDDAYIVGSLA